MVQINDLKRGQMPRVIQRIKRTETTPALVDAAFDLDELPTTTLPPNLRVDPETGELHRCV